MVMSLVVMATAIRMINSQMERKLICVCILYLLGAPYVEILRKRGSAVSCVGGSVCGVDDYADKSEKRAAERKTCRYQDLLHRLWRCVKEVLKKRGSVAFFVL